MTGVQTCALPICCVDGSDPSDGSDVSGGRGDGVVDSRGSG